VLFNDIEELNPRELFTVMEEDLASMYKVETEVSNN
jgi:hypothetical protein